jgi:hypothetical protein
LRDGFRGKEALHFRLKGGAQLVTLGETSCKAKMSRRM